MLHPRPWTLSSLISFFPLSHLTTKEVLETVSVPVSCDFSSFVLESDVLGPMSAPDCFPEGLILPAFVQTPCPSPAAGGGSNAGLVLGA